MKKTFEGRLIIKKRGGYCRGFERVREKFLMFILRKEHKNIFEFKVNADHLTFVGDSYPIHISSLDITDERNKILVKLLNFLYESKGYTLKDMIDDDLIMKNVSISDLNLFLQYAEEISFNVEIVNDKVVDIEFNNLKNTYELNEGIKNYKIYDTK